MTCSSRPAGEFFGVWERIKPTIAEGREQWANKQFLGNIEQAAQRYEVWIEKRSPGHLAKMREFMKQNASPIGESSLT